MKPVKIITDSCSDLTVELMEKYDIDYARMFYRYNDVEKYADLTWSETEVKELYDLMRKGVRVTTAQVTAEEYTNLFTKYLDEGKDIVYLACSGKLSNSINTAKQVAEELMAKYEGAKVICIDSLNACVALGALAVEASKMAKDGMGAYEVAEKITSMRKKVNQFCTLHSLKTMHKAGRVTGATAFFGNLLGVKPILICNADGEQMAYKKVKGRGNSIKEIVALAKEAIIDGENQTIYFEHSDANKEEVEEVVKLIKAEIPCKDVYISYIGPIIGGTIGPEALNIVCFGKEVTARNEEK